MNSIVPAAATQAFWASIETLMRDAGLPSAIRQLDKLGLNQTDPAAFIRLASLSASPIVERVMWRHFQITFLGFFENRAIYPELTAAGVLTFYRKEVQSADYVMISGSLTDWCDVIPIWSTNPLQPVTKVATTVYQYLRPFKLWPTTSVTIKNDTVAFLR